MTPQTQSRKSRALCDIAPVTPVIVIQQAAKAEALARALVSGGLPVLEVTLRSDAALDAIRAMSGVEGGHVGAGVLGQLRLDFMDAGADTHRLQHHRGLLARLAHRISGFTRRLRAVGPVNEGVAEPFLPMC